MRKRSDDVVTYVLSGNEDQLDEARVPEICTKIYEAEKLVMANPKQFIKKLRIALVRQKKPLGRLFAAWLLGLTHDRDNKSFNLLCERYEVEVKRKEHTHRIRTNIVWAIFTLRPRAVDKKLFESFLDDHYFHVRLLALKNMAFVTEAHGKFNFLKYYDQESNHMATFELLRNIRFFNYEVDEVCRILKTDLKETTEPRRQLALMEALSLLNSSASLEIIYDHFRKQTRDPEWKSLFDYQFAGAITTLCQTRHADILKKIYCGRKPCPQPLVRLKVIEALAAGGGPNNFKVLRELQACEGNKTIRKENEKIADEIQKDQRQSH